MNIINYINKYGDKTFEEKSLNEIDKLIFSQLAYVKYDGLISSNSHNKKTIEQVGYTFFINTTKKEISNNILAIRTGINILNRVRVTNRYKNLLVYSDIYVGDSKQQFSAMCIEINPKLIYVSFEGTDHLMSGWEEDCKIAYEFPVPAQRQAIWYMNKNFLFRDCKIIVGGHSKGGNLALVSSMYALPVVKKKIIEVYSYDGPGLRKKQFNSKKYKEIKNKFTHVIPNNSIVGLLFRHDDDHKVIKSNRFGIMAHNALTWQIDGDNFIEAELSSFSKLIDEVITTWLDKYNDYERKQFVAHIFEIFEKNKITSLIQIMDNYKLIISLIKDASGSEKIVKDMTKDLLKILVESNKNHIKSKFIKD